MELRALQRRKERQERGRFTAEGVRVVEDLMASGLVVRWVVTASSLEDSERGSALAAEIERRGIPRRAIPDRDFAALAATETPQAVIAVADVPRAGIDDFRLSAAPAVVLVLDAVQDPGNFGTLTRSAEALGAVGVIALPGTVDPWNAKSIRAAAGSSFRVPIVQLAWVEARSILRERGVEILGAALEGEPIGQEVRERVALVVGNEGAGLSREVREGVDRLVRIPLRGRAESLNVAAAAAILLYELARDRPPATG
jgi:RNA methyltransferase, TrmH family